MITMAIEKVKEMGFKGITVEGDYHFYNQVGFKTSSEFGIYPTSGIPLTEPRCMMCQELYEGALNDIHGYLSIICIIMHRALCHGIREVSSIVLSSLWVVTRRQQISG